MTAINTAASKKKWEEIAELRKRVNEMSNSFGIQKNVNKSVKDGVKDIVLWIEHVEEDHLEIIGKEIA